MERITRGQRENAEEEIRRQKALTARRAAARKDSGEEKVATKLALLKEVIAHTHTLPSPSCVMHTEHCGANLLTCVCVYALCMLFRRTR